MWKWSMAIPYPHTDWPGRNVLSHQGLSEGFEPAPGSWIQITLPLHQSPETQNINMLPPLGHLDDNLSFRLHMFLQKCTNVLSEISLRLTDLDISWVSALSSSPVSPREVWGSVSCPGVAEWSGGLWSAWSDTTLGPAETSANQLGYLFGTINMTKCDHMPSFPT